MTRHNAAYAMPDDAPALADDARSEGETQHRQFPAAYALYASDIYNCAVVIGESALQLNVAMLARNAESAQKCADQIATMTARANSVAELLAKRMSELRRRNPLSKV